jgi:hypothetical protein
MEAVPSGFWLFQKLPERDRFAARLELRLGEDESARGCATAMKE